MNRLAEQKSLYLRQHANNPVDWYPWGEEALRKAREENKPIFLSIGYASCHWCHVMAKESFEDSQIAQLLNERFVPVKVDREERPDLDELYMAFVQATTGQGGWPLSVWLTPDRKPFYGGTYFPKDDRWGRPGFGRVLERIAWLWENQPERLREHGEQAVQRLKELLHLRGDSGGEEAVGSLPAEIVENVFQAFRQDFDPVHGGFGGAPKFPRPSILFFLFRYAAWRRPVDPRAGEALGMACKTLEGMGRGGIRDHLGGGFHRYAVDGAWKVPHFEKMLYDQAQLALVYLEGFQWTGAREWAEVARETLEFALRELASREGAFYSSLAADSPDPQSGGEPKEGAFYLWTLEELDSVLEEPLRELVHRFYGLSPEGNIPQEVDAHGELRRKNVLWQAAMLEEVAQELGLSREEASQLLQLARRQLWEARERRPKPWVDDKIVAGWNGLMISALARVGTALEEAVFVECAERCGEFLWSQFWDPLNERLFRIYRNGVSDIGGFALDYACVVSGFLELFEATGREEWLERACRVQHSMDRRFWDDGEGGYFAAEEDPSLWLRLKERYDGAEPAPQSIALSNLVRLSSWTGEKTYWDRAEALVRAEGKILQRFPEALPWFAGVLPRLEAPPTQLVLVASHWDDRARELKKALFERFLPFVEKVLVSRPTGTLREVRDRVANELQWLPKDDPGPSVYICQKGACQVPIRDPRIFEATLKELAPRTPEEVAPAYG
ncbi:thioredoxin domain-containing protein [Candidatus Methylacidithermus pantelleriae]|uniref:Thymidylate kinase n=1 Tax=Candidatus Methylacidithermus pantelleriae TaxID=2744239 RepID=A0A8J2BUH0_9BACT|nr:thioredoxin domain-containing protein [Candidatus Methylacidithermus pantelleriae]CAF0701233.1 Thymidylate kinase [Candidatus Methylacidithermus pantelleriae]